MSNPFKLFRVDCCIKLFGYKIITNKGKSPFTYLSKWMAVVSPTLHISIAGYNPYILFILTIDYSKNFTTNKVLTIVHMSMFVVTSIVLHSNCLAYGSICWYNNMQWTVPQLSIMIIYNGSWSNLIQWITVIISGGKLT